MASSALVMFVCALLAAPAVAAPGDVYVSDQDAGPAGSGAVFRISPSGGEATPLASGAPLVDPTGMAFDRGGKLLIADYGAGRVFRLDPETGDLTTFVSGAPLAAPRSVALGPDGFVYVFDSNSALPGNPAGLFRVNPLTKAVTTVTAGPQFNDSQPTGTAIDLGGNAFLGNISTSIPKVNLATAAVTTFTGTAASFAGPGIVVSADRHTLTYVADNSELQKLTTATGASTPFATVPGAGLRYLAPLPSGFLATDATQKEVWRADASGAPVTPFSTDSDFTFPDGILVEPRRCGGLVPTAIGTSGRDVIRGSRFADVISGLGGRDTIKGLKGSDRLCGGKGRDRLIGGSGKDRLIGGPGRDVARP